jgi:tetratricopeptide (TPR) repeat protein
MARDLREQGKTEQATLVLIAAEEQSRRLLEEAQKNGDLHLKYLGAIRYSEICSGKKDFEASLHWVNVAEQTAIELNASRIMSNVWARKGSILMSQGKLDEAESYLLKSLDLRTRLGLRRHIAANKERLAKLYLQMGKAQLARQYAEEAKDLYKRLGMEKPYENIEKLMKAMPA